MEPEIYKYCIYVKSGSGTVYTVHCAVTSISLKMYQGLETHVA
jgi:hypothetical protein